MILLKIILILVVVGVVMYALTSSSKRIKKRANDVRLKQQSGRLTNEEWIHMTELTVKFAHQGLRIGQSYINALAEVRFDLYEKIKGTECDPMYQDGNIHKFMEFLNQKPIDDENKVL